MATNSTSNDNERKKKHTAKVFTCYYCFKTGHFANECPYKISSPIRVKCYRCGKLGHFSKDCSLKSQLGGISTSGSSKSGSNTKKNGSVVCVKKRADVKKVEEIEDCFILEFDPTKPPNNDDYDGGSDDIKGFGSVICVKKREDVKKVEEFEDCFILEFDPFDMGKVKVEPEVKEDDDGGDEFEVIRGVVCVKKVEDVKKVEEVEDCFILEFDPNEPVKFSNLSLGDSSEVGTSEDDLCVLSEKGQVACRDYPHPRHLCAKHPFKKTPHDIHCKMCYCYICDSPAPCKAWTRTISNHCNATPDVLFWRVLREGKKGNMQ